MKIKFIILVFSIFIPLNCSFAEVIQFERYRNEEYKFQINKPKEWIAIDKQHYTQLFSQMQLQDPRGTVICTFIKDPNINSPPLVTVGLLFHQEQVSIEEYLKALNAVVKNDENIIEKPKIINLGDRKVIKYTARMIQPIVYRIVIAETYLFFEGNNIFNVGALADLEEYESVKQMFKEIVTSFNSL